ncbi:hypothetical protein [Candidatus Rickettsia colombianensi]|uniref:hypothetical protein n=1 Tax=Candidatus Rickettsia colombianensi TaxID=1090944 RepID=UPI000EF29124|nr:hypothetical protein [Candidatus Rickettsia colombianensi]
MIYAVKKNKTNAEKKYEEQIFCNPASLNICYQEISDELAELIADKLKSIKTTTTVNFSGSQLSDKGIKVISKALKTSLHLEKLDFSDSNLGDQKI